MIRSTVPEAKTYYQSQNKSSQDMGVVDQIQANGGGDINLETKKSIFGRNGSEPPLQMQWGNSRTWSVTGKL